MLTEIFCKTKNKKNGPFPLTYGLHVISLKSVLEQVKDVSSLVAWNMLTEVISRNGRLCIS